MEKTRAKRILVVSHDASRSGAPLLLLHLLRWLLAHSEFSIEILLARGGELEPQFYALGRASRLRPAASLVREMAALRAQLPHLHPRLHFMQATDSGLRVAERVGGALFALRHRRTRFDLIYSNTVANGPLLRLMSDYGCPIITHAHELEYAIGLMGENFQSVLTHTNHWIATSQAVKNNLVINHGVASHSVDVVYGCIPTPHARGHFREACALLRQQIGAAPDSFIVAAAGTVEWRKGSDLWVQLASAVMRRRPGFPVYFLWLGGGSNATLKQLAYDARALGLQERVKFLGAQPNLLEYFAACDAFALMSREEPLGLVCLEAAAVELPVLCFAGAGGAPEFVEKDCGFVVPYLDVGAMADKLVSLMDSVELRHSLGQNGGRKVRQRHTIEAVAPHLLTILNRFS